MREKWLCINRKEYLHDTMMQMRSVYERLIYNLTTVTGHFAEWSGVNRTKKYGNEKKRGSGERTHERARTRALETKCTRQNVLQFHARKVTRKGSWNASQYNGLHPIQRMSCGGNYGQYCRNKLTWMNELF